MIWTAGIDIGGTNLKAVAVTAGGEVLHRGSWATADGVAGAGEWVQHACGAVTDFANRVGRAPVGIGVGAPGLAALDWTSALAQPALVPVLNDAHAALLGEAWIGAAAGRRHVVMLTLGTGVGGAVLSDGRLLRGAIGRAGHIGHLSLDPDGPPSIVGMPGAIEGMIGDCTIAARSGGKFTHTAALVAAHRAGDAEATRIWQRSVRALAFALGSCINLFDPEIIVLGGGIAQAGAELFGPLGTELDRIEWRPGGHRVPVVPAVLGEWAGAIGAARQALPQLCSAPS